jgi:hypothetical protein
MERRSRLYEARTRLIRLARLQRPDEPKLEEPQITVYPGRRGSVHEERARELMQRPEFAQFRNKN